MSSAQARCPACGADLAEGLCPQCLLLAGVETSGDSPRTGWQPPTPEELQAQLVSYEVRELVGHGGMGAVYKGWQTSLERHVAIKVLSPALAEEDLQFATRFRQEARTMARLSHPDIVTVYDFGETPDGLCYIVMEFIEGTDVQRMIAREGRLPPERALEVAIHVCNALACAHEHGIIHRDIKPGNVLVDAQGRVKVTDFGLAKGTQGAAALLTGTHTAMGTPGYIAPEMFVEGERVDARADVYALGVTLYAMLTGRVPQGRFDPAGVHVPALDPRFDQIVNRAMQERRDARYASALELRGDLTTILTVPSNSRGISRLAARAQSLARPLPVGLRLLWLVGIVLGTALAAGLFFSRPWTKTPVSRSAASPATAAAAHALSSNPATATNEAPFVNSLAMRFVPVPIRGGPSKGQRVLFSVWHTRVQDYAAFASARQVDNSWTNQNKDGVPVGREPNHPVTGVSWEDAQAFCDWLSEKEAVEGWLPKGMKYRLPTDEEWSWAVGLPAESGETPAEKSGKNRADFPWGHDYPPTGQAGNYADETYHQKFPKPDAKVTNQWIEGYTDGYATTSPVGSFPANLQGLYDMGGNAWQWCDDWFDASHKLRVLRGASWTESGTIATRSSNRGLVEPIRRVHNVGFRCVLAATVAPAIFRAPDVGPKLPEDADRFNGR